MNIFELSHPKNLLNYIYIADLTKAERETITQKDTRPGE